MKSRKYLLSAVGFYTFLTLPAFAGTADEKINQKIKDLQTQLNELRTQLKTVKASTQSTKSAENSAEVVCSDHSTRCKIHTAQISMGSYLDRDSLFDGSDLLVQVPGVREDARLLLQEQSVVAKCQSLKIPTPTLPRLVFSGKLEGQMSFLKNYQNSSVTNIDFTGAELATFIQTSDFISGYMTFDYNPTAPGNGSEVFMNRAFITIGNLNRFPVYSSVGQMYAAFGRYSSGMISSPVTLSLGRTRVRALALGYQQVGDNAFHAETYVFQGLTHETDQTNTHNEYGFGTGYSFKLGRSSGEIGVGYISNLADSQGLQSTVFIGDETLNRSVPAIDLYGSLAFNPFVLIAEYVQATKQFDASNMSFQNHGAQPKALHLEADYNFTTFAKPSSVGVAYGHTAQALAASLPKDQYSIFYNINLFKATNFAIEYRHDVNYKSSAATTDAVNPTPADVLSTLGKEDNVITAQFDLYF